MNWFLKLIGVDAAIRELKDELTLEIQRNRSDMAKHMYSDIAHKELKAQQKELIPRLVPYVFEQIDKGNIRTWEQYTDWYNADHTKAVNWSNRISTISSTEEQASWIIEATKFAHIKLPINPNGPPVGLTGEDDPYGPAVLCPPMPCVECTGNPGCSASSGMPNPWDYDSYDPGFVDTMINHNDSALNDWLNKTGESEDAFEDPDAVDSSSTDS